VRKVPAATHEASVINHKDAVDLKKMSAVHATKAAAAKPKATAVEHKATPAAVEHKAPAAAKSSIHIRAAKVEDHTAPAVKAKV